jgi:hypothetical protein
MGRAPDVKQDSQAGASGTRPGGSLKAESLGDGRRWNKALLGKRSNLSCREVEIASSLRSSQ